MKVREFDGTGESYIDYDFEILKSCGFEFAGTEEFNIYSSMVKIFKRNRSKNIDDSKTISILNKSYKETAWSYYIADYDRFKYLLDKAKNK